MPVESASAPEIRFYECLQGFLAKDHRAHGLRAACDMNGIEWEDLVHEAWTAYAQRPNGIPDRFGWLHLYRAMTRGLQRLGLTRCRRQFRNVPLTVIEKDGTRPLADVDFTDPEVFSPDDPKPGARPHGGAQCRAGLHPFPQERSKSGRCLGCHRDRQRRYRERQGRPGATPASV